MPQDAIISPVLNVHKYLLNGWLDSLLFWTISPVWAPPVLCLSPHPYFHSKDQIPTLDFVRRITHLPVGPRLCTAALCCPPVFGISSLCSQLRQPLAPWGAVSILQGHLCCWPPYVSLGTKGNQVGWKRSLWPLCVCFYTLISYLFSSITKTKSVEHFHCLFFLWPPLLPFLEPSSKYSSLWVLLHLRKYSGLFSSSPAT